MGGEWGANEGRKGGEWGRMRGEEGKFVQEREDDMI